MRRTVPFLKTRNTKIISPAGKQVFLRGVNAGGWLMMEAYFLHSPNLPEQKFRKEFIQRNGAKAMEEFDQWFRDNFIREEDFRRIARLGFNCVRLPFHYRVVEKSPYRCGTESVSYLDNAVRWAAKYKIWVILDLHAAPGAQNNDWHSDSDGRAALWTSPAYQKRVYALWEYLADRYKDKPWVAGYDVLNEAVMQDVPLLNRFYRHLIKTIRRVDRNHILFIEGNTWAQDIACLDRMEDDNYVLSVHNYEPPEFTFNFVPNLVYPLKRYGKSQIHKRAEAFYKEAEERNVPVFVGEFGVNYRRGHYNEQGWVKDTVAAYNRFGFHWTYWTYKAVKNNAHPDGIFSYEKNPPWVNRGGPKMGWETFARCWPAHKKAMCRSWRTDQFAENTPVLRVLRDGIR